ncbi:hypothetical protein Fmac_007245 [Flemingia macrophylla]|uniref:Uncharacterized protein n=1 Tax=Flemingia macrophylla TaxID=520843 RepID=A0ABD1NCW9_9FABA
MARGNSEERDLTNETFLESNNYVARNVKPIMRGFDGSSLPPEGALKDEFERQHSVSLVQREAVGDLQRDRDGRASDQRRHRDGAVLVLVERRQQNLGRDGLAPVRDEGGDAVVVKGEAPVGVPYEDGELHGCGHEGRGAGVQAVDGGADHREAGLVGAVHEPEDEEGDAGQ